MIRASRSPFSSRAKSSPRSIFRPLSEKMFVSRATSGESIKLPEEVHHVIMLPIFLNNKNDLDRIRPIYWGEYSY
jgi:hypothetical protein